MSGAYDDIIHLPRHVSPRRRPMPLADRAAQFSPFAALTGYDETIRETGRRTDTASELAEDEKELLDRDLQELERRLPERPQTAVTYFIPDPRKSGGAYAEAAGRLLGIDRHRRRLILEDGSVIPLDKICRIRGPWKE